jgi:hypothetical protein
MICILMYAVKAVADTLLLVSQPIGQMAGVLIALGSIIGIITYVPRLIRAILSR